MARKEAKTEPMEKSNKVKRVDGEEIISFAKDGEPTIIENKEPKADSKDMEIVKRTEEIERLKNSQLRLQADFENYKKRNAELSRKSYLDGGIDTITAFLPLIDTFDRALSMIDAESNSGIMAIKKQLDNILVGLSVTEIEAVGKEFDPKYHNAVMQVEDADNADKVVEVLQKGYIYKDKIVRHAMVKVAK